MIHRGLVGGGIDARRRLENRITLAGNGQGNDNRYLIIRHERTVMPDKTKMEIKAPQIGLMKLMIEGVTPLLSNRKAPEIAQGIEDIKSGKNTGSKSKIVLTPEEQYQRSLHVVIGDNGEPTGEYGFPAGGFKKAAVAAACGKDWWDGNIDGKRFKGSVQVIGDVVPIKGELGMKVDDGRRPARTGAPCKIYRGQFKNWSCELPIRFNADLMSPDEIIAVFNMAGFAIGIGDDRPGKNGGQFGQFKVIGVTK